MKNIFLKIQMFIKRPEGFYVIASIFSGIIFSLLIPPFQTPDEYIHFYRAYEVSEGKAPVYNQKLKGSGSYLPVSIAQTESVVKAGGDQIRFDPREKYDIRSTKAAIFDVPLNRDKQKFYDTTQSDLRYFPINYLPQAVFISIGKLLNLPVIIMVYLVRFGLLMIWATVGYFAVKIIPWRKWSLVGILLIPVAIAQSVSPGLDVMVFGAALTFIVMCFRAYEDKNYKLTMTRLSLLLALGILMTFGKFVTITILPILFIVKSTQIKLKHSNITKLLIFFTPIILFMSWTLLTKDTNPAAVNANSIVQRNTLINNPLNFMMELFSTFFFVWGDSVTQSLIGNFGWLDTPLSAPFVCLGAVILIAYLTIDYSVDKDVSDVGLTKPSRRFVALLAMGYFIATCMSMYVYSSDPDLKYIIGVQGRYFIPLIILLIPILVMKTLKFDHGKYDIFVKKASISLILISICTIFFRYYVVYFPAT